MKTIEINVTGDVATGDIFEVDAADLVALAGAAVALRDRYGIASPELRFHGGTLTLGLAYEGYDDDGEPANKWEAVYREGDGEDCWTFEGAGRRWYTPAEAVRDLAGVIDGG